MERYETYKDSEVEWIGEIPEEWEVKRLKYLASINDESLPESTEGTLQIKYVDISNVKSGTGILSTEELSFSEAPSRARRIVRDGDVIVSTVRTYLKSIAKINNPPENLIVSTGFAVIRPRMMVSDYIGYVFYSENLIGEIISRSTGVSYPAINAPEIGDIFTPIPNSQEQTAIANYLDRKTAEIDALIAQKQRLIELYHEEKTVIINNAVTQGIDPNVPLKDSGINWLGDIPEGWEVKKLKYLTTYFKGFAFKSLDFKESGVPVVKASNLKNKVVANVSSYIGLNNQKVEFEKVKLKSGDVIVSTVGSKPDVKESAVGQLASIDESLSGAYLNQNTLCIRPTSSVSDKYLKFAFFSRYMRSRFDAKSLWIVVGVAFGIAACLQQGFNNCSFESIF